MDEQMYDYGGVGSTTNQRMEVYAALEAMISLETDLRVFTDSMYLVNCASGRWKRKANRDLWDSFEAVEKERAGAGLRTSFRWVKGHSGVRLNEVADRLADLGMRERGPAPIKVSRSERVRSIPAKFGGSCWYCGQSFIVGESITLFLADGEKNWGHTDPCHAAWASTQV